MKRILKELYGAGILFFYFFKWPYFLFFPYLYNIGLQGNIILNLLWFYTLVLILKDLYRIFRK